MNEITIHFKTQNQSIDPEFLERLEKMADEYGVSIDSSTRESMECKLPVENDIKENEEKCLSHEEFVRRAKEISCRIGPVDTDSADFLRTMRDNL